MRIVPAILAEETDGFLSTVKTAERFADYVQIDIMDGEFVPSKSFDPEVLNTLNTDLLYELHLMVKFPETLISRITADRGLKKVFFHYEADVRHMDLIRQLRERHIIPGLALNPETSIDDVRQIAEYVDTLLFLTVDPCCYGHPFRPDVLRKVAEGRRSFPHLEIAVDGGVSLENLPSFFEIGVDYVCVGSGIFRAEIPEDRYRLFLNAVKELEAKQHRARRS